MIFYSRSAWSGLVLFVSAVLSFATPSLAQDEMGAESAALSALIEVNPPQGWERSRLESGIFKGCYGYMHKPAPEEKEKLGVLACIAKNTNQNCEEAVKDAEPEMLRHFGKATYLTQNDKALFICMPARNGKAEAFFVVMAEDAYRKYEARDMLAAFTQFHVPAEELTPAPNLNLYLPQAIAGEEEKSEWGGIKRVYRSPEEGERITVVTLLPYFPHWADIPQYQRAFRYTYGELVPEGHSWRGSEKRFGPFLMALSHDKKVVLLITCSTEAAVPKYKAAFDKFNW